MKESQKAFMTADAVLPKILILLLVVAFLAATGVPAEAKPTITRCDATYAANTLTVNVQWQSENPVVMVRILAGMEQKDIQVSEFDNTQTPRGFRGEVSVAIRVDNPGEAISYVVNLEDDVRGKSEQFTGKLIIVRKMDSGTGTASGGYPGTPTGQYGAGGSVTYPGAPTGAGASSPYPGATTDPYGQTTGGGSIYDSVKKQMEQADLPPTLSAVSALTSTANTVDLSAQAHDDKALREIAYVIHDASGYPVHSDRASITDKDYSGTFATISTLTPGSYTVTAQAVDANGRVSKKVSATFKVLAAPVQLSVTVTPPEIASQAKFTLDGGAGVALEPVLMEDQTTAYRKTLLVEPNVLHKIVFSPVPGYTAQPQEFTIPAGKTEATQITGDYRRM